VSSAGSEKENPEADVSSKPQRILALDVGTRRIGLAVSDALGITAQGLHTLTRVNKRADFAALRRVFRKQNVVEIVVGHPLRMSGEASAQTDKVLAFVEELRAEFAGPIHLWDERLTSAQANRLLDESGHTRRERKGVVDEMAAMLILQSFMEARGVQDSRDGEK
jgi:putative holliday junction resolvase